MKCPYCGHEEDKVLESRTVEEGMAIRRRRECEGCGRRFTSKERVELVSFQIVKKDKRREDFKREKIRNGVIRACEKRPVSMEQIEQIVDEIERELMELMPKDQEISSQEIGEKVMGKLQRLDQVAYVRFASVYRSFKDVGEFIKEIKDHFTNK